MTGSVIQGKFPNGVARHSQSLVRQQKQHARVQRLPNGSASQLPGVISRVHDASGQPLPAAVLQMMESLFSTTFADVRIHVGPEASAVGAVAYTQGSHVYFAPGHYNPATPHGRQLLAHELTHVVQQRAQRVRNPFGSGVALVQDHGLDAEAERMAARAIVQRTATSRTVQRSAAAAAVPAAARTLVSYNVIGMLQDCLEATAVGTGKRTKKWEDIDHAVIGVGTKYYGWGEECTVERVNTLYVVNGNGVTFYGWVMAKGTVDKAMFDSKTKEWLALIKRSHRKTYPYNCRGYVDYVRGIIDETKFG